MNCDLDDGFVCADGAAAPAWLEKARSPPGAAFA